MSLIELIAFLSFVRQWYTNSAVNLIDNVVI